MNETKPINTGALAGLKVIDLSRVLGGPFAGQILADHGAEVIKVEPPTGDETREWGPPFLAGTASYFLGLNRNKRAIALDLSQAEGREVLLHLLEEADVLLENFKTGTLEKWDLGYETDLKTRFPRLIHARVSGFGADGPLGGLPSYDAVLQAMGGIMSVNGATDGDPTRVGVPVVDMTTGLNMVIGILLALQARHKTGQGQFVEASLFDAALSFLHPHAANYALNQRIPKQTGNDHPNISPYSTYQTGTRAIYLAVGNDRQFTKLCEVINAPHLAKDERFLRNGDRVINRVALRTELEQIMADQDGIALADCLIRSGVPAGAVLNVAETLALPHTQHREMVIKLGEYTGIGAPIKASDNPAYYHRPPPAFAEHNHEVLLEAGYSAQDIQHLETKGVLVTQRKP